MDLQANKEYICPYCKKLSKTMILQNIRNKTYYLCPKCSRYIFETVNFEEVISYDLNLRKRDAVIYHNKKKVESIEINDKSELIFEYIKN